VEFVGPGGEDSLGCWVHDLYDGERMRPERLQAFPGAAHAVRQPRRVQGRSGHPGGPSFLNYQAFLRLGGRVIGAPRALSAAAVMIST
jgi:hypothetical protein